jgi:hypothetical protein
MTGFRFSAAGSFDTRQDARHSVTIFKSAEDYGSHDQGERERDPESVSF